MTSTIKPANPNRRDLLLLLGATAVGVTGLSLLQAADHDAHGNNLADGCAKICRDFVKANA